ncbi:hypothetical protein EKO27_g10877 [Xylaria grammica]|uniref:GPI inositol-deacylase winged helix domain-containing protein n=1 Tax=Xylaria grammica TaxID=363999 RepID=A0A439CPZ9_9PEZI|nr:hypothetical protein EKO27_g10877 [Xylaria grammica]
MKAIRKALEKLATGSNAYDTAYDYTMKRIGGQLQEQANRANQVLSWITCAERPLTELELQHALAVEINEPELDKDNLPQIKDVVSVCAGLITVDEVSSIVRLVHYTTQDYFVRTQSKWFPDAQLSITIICITYLSYQSFADGRCGTYRRLEKRFRLHPFYDYAARNWGHHGRKASACQDIISFLRKPAQVEASSQLLLLSTRFAVLHGFHGQMAQQHMTGLHLAAYFGLDKVIVTMIGDFSVNERDSNDRTPLSWAVYNNHEAVVRLLLNAPGIDLNSKDSSGSTPLWWAVNNRHEAVVRLLLNAPGIDPNLKDNCGDTLLCQAARQGLEAVVYLLLNGSGINPNLMNNSGDTSLLLAARNGHEAVVRLLLDTKEVDPNLKDRKGRTSLWWALSYRHEAVVELLLSTGRVDLDPKDYAGLTPEMHRRGQDRADRAIWDSLLVEALPEFRYRRSRARFRDSRRQRGNVGSRLRMRSNTP